MSTSTQHMAVIGPCGLRCLVFKMHLVVEKADGIISCIVGHSSLFVAKFTIACFMAVRYCRRLRRSLRFLPKNCCGKRHSGPMGGVRGNRVFECTPLDRPQDFSLIAFLLSCACGSALRDLSKSLIPCTRFMLLLGPHLAFPPNFLYRLFRFIHSAARRGKGEGGV